MKNPHHSFQQSQRGTDNPSVCEIMNSITFVISLHDLRTKCSGYDADFLDQVLLELERDGKLVIAEGKVFPIRTPVDHAEIIQFPGQLPGKNEPPHQWELT